MDIDDFVTVSGRWPVFTPRPHPPWEEALTAYLLDLARSLQDAGCVMIGHVKGMLGDAWGDPLYFSLTTFAGPPRFKGGSPDQDEEQDMSIDVIAAGLDQAAASRILEHVIHNHFHTPGI